MMIWGKKLYHKVSLLFLILITKNSCISPPENYQTSIFPQFSEYNPKRHKTDFQNALRRGVVFSKINTPAVFKPVL